MKHYFLKVIDIDRNITIQGEQAFFKVRCTMNSTAQNALIAADRLFEIMDLEREETENKVELQRENLYWRF